MAKSYVAEAKFNQNYIEKPIHKMCSNCIKFICIDSYCGLGNFKVKKTACCSKHNFTEEYIRPGYPY